jgi:hypothetical protein
VTGPRRRSASPVSPRRASGPDRSRRSRRPWRLGPSPTRAAALLGVLASSLALYGLTTAPAFAIRRIEVPALTWTDQATVLRWLGVETGSNAFLLRTSRLGDRVESLPAILAASVSVSLPGTVVVHVTEREPILAWRAGKVTFLVDRDGVLFALASANEGAAAGLPTINDARAASAIGLSVGARIDTVDLDAATRLASLVPDDVGSGATSLAVKITDADGFVVTTSPASWAAVFGPYSTYLRPTSLIPGQVRLLRSLLFGREAGVARITLADETHGTYLPRPSGG